MRFFKIIGVLILLSIAAIAVSWRLGFLTESTIEKSKQGAFASLESSRGAVNDLFGSIQNTLPSGGAGGRSRIWTDATGRTLEGELISATESEIILKVSSNDRIYRLPLQKLSTDDQTFVRTATGAMAGDDQYPHLPDRWPTTYDGRNSSASASPAATGSLNHWRTKSYDIRSTDELDEKTLRSLALICESIDGAVRSVPLPITWGRSPKARRVIQVYHTDEEYFAAGGPRELAGHFDPRNGSVHIRLSHLIESDMRQSLGQYQLSRRQQFDLLVHELVHQAGAGLSHSDCHAWVCEGIAEMFSAAQNTIGYYSFQNVQASVRNHLTSHLAYDGLIQIRTLRLEKLENYFDRSLYQFNRITAKSKDGGFQNYCSALVLTEFFTFGDSNYLRPYLEAVMTGTDAQEASRKFLLRERSFEEIERLISDRWKTQGIEVVFEVDPELKEDDLRGDVGLESSISSFRRPL